MAVAAQRAQYTVPQKWQVCVRSGTSTLPHREHCWRRTGDDVPSLESEFPMVEPSRQGKAQQGKVLLQL
jgi:hypothetical protein